MQYVPMCSELDGIVYFGTIFSRLPILFGTCFSLPLSEAPRKSIQCESKREREKLKKKFTNKQQIKIWQKCVQIIMECKRKAASYETYAAKNKEINILSVKKGRRKNSNVDVVYIFNTLAHTFYVNDIEREWAPESEWNEEKKVPKWEVMWNERQKLFGLKRNERSHWRKERENGRKYEKVFAGFFRVNMKIFMVFCALFGTRTWIEKLNSYHYEFGAHLSAMTGKNTRNNSAFRSIFSLSARLFCAPADKRICSHGQ